MGASYAKEADEVEYSSTDEGFTKALRTHLQILITYAKGADPALQREVAEKLANEAVKPDRQEQIVELNGLQLLLPLTQSRDIEVQRLAAHALANLSGKLKYEYFLYCVTPQCANDSAIYACPICVLENCSQG